MLCDDLASPPSPEKRVNPFALKSPTKHSPSARKWDKRQSTKNVDQSTDTSIKSRNSSPVKKKPLSPSNKDNVLSSSSKAAKMTSAVTEMDKAGFALIDEFVHKTDTSVGSSGYFTPQKPKVQVLCAAPQAVYCIKFIDV